MSIGSHFLLSHLVDVGSARLVGRQYTFIGHARLRRLRRRRRCVFAELHFILVCSTTENGRDGAVAAASGPASRRGRPLPR